MRAGLVTSYPFPITGTKIHPPLLRPDTLSRPRLNGWMDTAARGRVVLIVAEAGFGKTTLLADWAAQSTRRTAWYRLEPDDADWLTFLRHLLASAREIDPEFGLETMELLLALGTGGPKKADVIASLVRELGDFGSTLPTGLTLIFDDHHVIDGSADTQHILRALVERTGPSFSIVLASRTVPTLPLGRLRARGGLARLDGDELCFDIPETDRLFREAYHRPLEPDVVEELIKRTDGWAALLTLVRTSLEDKNAPEARALVAQLSATRGDLYDFLAEEVLVSLSPALQRFLTRVSVLVSVDAETGAIVDDLPPDDIAPLIAEAESLGLLSRPDRGAPHRFHPLVRDFLLERLTTEIGQPAVRDLHHRVAVALEGTNWFASAWHYREAGEPTSAARVIDDAVPGILASGAFDLAAPFLDGSAGSVDRASALILRARLELGRGSLRSATRLGKQAVDEARGGPRAGTALLNLAAMHGIVGYEDESVLLAREALSGPLSGGEALIAQSIVAVRSISADGDLDAAADQMRRLAALHKREGLRRYAAISLLYLSATLDWLGRPAESLAAATEAEVELVSTGARGVELAAILSARALALAQLNRMPEAEQVLQLAAEMTSQLSRDEVGVEGARLYTHFGQRTKAEAMLGMVDVPGLSGGYIGFHALAAGELALRRRDATAARESLHVLEDHPCNDTAAHLRTSLLRARLALLEERRDALGLASETQRIAELQGSRPGRLLAGMVTALADEREVHEAIVRVPPELNYCISILAEDIAEHADRLTDEALARVVAEAARRPDRWRDPLITSITRGAGGSSRSADLLSVIGSAEDAAALRELAVKRVDLRPATMGLTQRLAQPVLIDDLGRVQVFLGTQRLKVVRRKVLGLLCYLVTRPGMAATRDEVLEVLWPEMGANTATNSLHQTIYVLRRVFEPNFREWVTAGYVTYDGEVVSLRPDLVGSRSRDCWHILAGSPRGSVDVEALLETYTGQFALDFTYEDWATDYRETLHAAVLAACEAAMKKANSSGEHEAAIRWGLRVLTIDPGAEGIELALLRSYKASGRQSAAAEQYAHYSAYVREELGAEPPSFEDL